MSISRRRFLEQITLTSAGLTAFRLLPPFAENLIAQPIGTGNPLRFPPTYTGDELIAKIITTNIWSDKQTTVWTWGDSFPPPIIRLRQGQFFSTRLVNQLSEPTNIHWHGLLVPAEMDGHPMDVVAPGQSRQYSFQINQPAGTYWYHPHAHKLTAKQAYMGMAGFFIIEDDISDNLNLPSEEFDIPLAIQDKRVNASRIFNYSPSMMDEMSGFLGETILVNGTPDSYYEVSRDIYRLRLLNGSNARILKLAFSDNSTFYLIGSDGGLLDKSYPVEHVWLAPGGRAEILVDFSNQTVGNTRTLRTLQYDPFADSTMQGYGMDIIRFDIIKESQKSFVIPSTLRPLEILNSTEATRTRSFSLGMVHSPGNMLHTINNKAYDMNRIDEQVVAGSIEIWEFINAGDEPHPMHFHGAQFQVIQRNNSTPIGEEDKGWKDVVIVEAGSTVQVAVRFNSETGLFLMHCHNLEHEDTGMMINYTISSSSSVDDDIQAALISAIYPNPASDTATVHLHVNTATNVGIDCYAINGELQAQITNGFQLSGNHDFQIDVSTFSSGQYIIELTCQKKRYQYPFKVAR